MVTPLFEQNHDLGDFQSKSDIKLNFYPKKVGNQFEKDVKNVCFIIKPSNQIVVPEKF